MIRALCVAVLVVLPSTAGAQGNPGPFGGLFGREPERSTGREFTVFDVRTSIAGESDDRVLDKRVPAEDRDISGQILGIKAGAMFAKQSDRLQLRLRSLGTYNEYPVQKVGATTVENTGVLFAKLTTRLSIDGYVSHVYAPFFNFLSVPMYGPEIDGVITVTAQPYATLLETNTLDGNFGFTSFYSKHSTFGLSGVRRQTRFIQSPQNDFTMNGFRGRWTRQLNRSLALRFEYGRDLVHLSSNPDTVLHETIDAGIDLTRALSLGRRTTLSIETQTSIMKQPLIGRQYRLNGGATVGRWIGKTWQFTLHGHRVTDFRPGFVEPLYSDTAGTRLTGMFNKRLEFTGYINGGRGRFGSNALTPRFTTVNSGEQISVAFSRHLAVFVTHGFDYYEIPPDASLVAPVTQYARNSFTVGITTWIPIFMRERVPSDTR